MNVKRERERERESNQAYLKKGQLSRENFTEPDNLQWTWRWGLCVVGDSGIGGGGPQLGASLGSFAEEGEALTSDESSGSGRLERTRAFVDEITTHTDLGLHHCQQQRRNLVTRGRDGGERWFGKRLPL
jgi:hypothetical protein